ncbi:MAG: mechanosensitive ion channel [Parachlamydiales bacterium]|nr:mechanosensitive ion channel [Parachlamydiales bacterium]
MSYFLNLILSPNHIWIFKIIISLILLTIFNLILSKFLNMIKKKSNIEKYDWKKKINDIFYSPIKLLLWIVAVFYILIVLAERFSASSSIIYIHAFRNVLIAIDVTYLIIKWKKEIEKVFIVKWAKKIDRSSVEFMGKIITIAIIFVASLIVLQFIGLNVMPLIAFGGIGAAAIGFAAKDVIANFFGGMMVYLSRPFINGDLVEIPDKHIIGHIEHIGWYNTLIREMNKVAIYIPNSTFSTVLIKNLTRMTHRRIEEEIGLRYKDISKVDDIVKEIRNLLQKHEDIDSNYTPYVFFDQYSDYYLKIIIKAYTVPTEFKEFMQLKQDILLEIRKILDKHEADIAFPTSNVELIK